MTKMRIEDAARAWVDSFNEYPTNMIAKLMNADPDDWQEVTDPGEYGQDRYDAIYDGLPMWGMMWAFSDPCDSDYWMERDGLKALSAAGFRVFYSDEFGYFFGIDGAGYDFYEAHWIPLYKARGLHWHDETADTVAAQ